LANRALSLLIFTVYFLAIFFINDLRNKNLLYVHHANFVGFLFCLIYAFYSSNLKFELNRTLCAVSETAWGLIHYLRPYSVVLIALYRFIAVFYNSTFKRLNASDWLLVLPIIAVWLSSSLMFLGTKFGFDTTSGYVYCMDGQNSNFGKVIGYLLVTSVISLFVPLVLVLVAYIRIRRKMNRANGLKPLIRSSLLVLDMANFGKSLPVPPADSPPPPPRPCAASSSSNLRKRMRRCDSQSQKNKRLDKQLLLINTCDFMCITITYGLNLRYIMQNFDAYFVYYRFVLRILNVFAQSMVPMITLYFSPTINSWFNRKRRRAAAAAATTAAVSSRGALGRSECTIFINNQQPRKFLRKMPSEEKFERTTFLSTRAHLSAGGHLYKSKSFVDEVQRD
jgi:hypothetical protein